MDESGLFAQATQGDRVALDQLLERYLPQLHAFVHARLGRAIRPRESSLDVVQSVCRKLLGHREVFEFHGEERFRAWLFTAALNKVREKHRRHHGAMRDPRREAPGLDHDAWTEIAHRLTPTQEAVGNETARILAAAMEAMSEEHREVISLARVVRLPHRVIAEVMDRSEEAVRQLLGRALIKLARELRQRGVDVDAPG